MNQESYRVKLDDSRRNSDWSALDPTSEHPLSRYLDGDDDTQTTVQKVKELQISDELILVKDSADVTVNSTDTKAALNLVAALNAAIALVIRISIASSNAEAEEIKQDLFQSTGIRQITVQKTVVENSRNVTIETTDTQIALNIQLLLQILIALLVNLDIL